jgi:multidrug resistance protein, MATE family
MNDVVKAFVGAALISLFNLIILAALRNYLPLLFTEDQEVIGIVAKILPLCAFMQIFDGLATMAHGLLRGIGRQSIGSYVNLASYYLVGMPISAATAFALDWKLGGLWLGVTIGLFL